MILDADAFPPVHILGRNETTGLRCMGACHPMATLKYTDSVTSFPQIICYIVVLKVLNNTSSVDNISSCSKAQCYSMNLIKLLTAA